jgi:hypothetical protein
MSNPWLALDLGTDPAERIRQVGRAHETFLTGGAAGAVRPVVVDSWRRSAAAVSADSTGPIELSDGDLESYRAAHPLARCYRSSRRTPRSVATSSPASAGRTTR